MNEFNELFIPVSYLKTDFDYIALGHYHKYTEVTNNTFYSGSTECLTFTDSGDKKGFIELELTDKKLKHNFITLKNRPMIDTKPIRCFNLNLNEVMKKIKDTVEVVEPESKIFRITLEDIPSHIYRGIDFSEIRTQSNKAAHYEIKAVIVRDGDSEFSENSRINALSQEFRTFLGNQNIEEKETLLELGMDYIGRVETRDEKG